MLRLLYTRPTGNGTISGIYYESYSELLTLSIPMSVRQIGWIGSNSAKGQSKQYYSHTV